MTATPRYAEDYLPGQVFNVGSHAFSAAEIIAFSSEWDPHPFHINEEAARQTMFGGLIASGWHTALVMMRMMHQGGFLSLETSIGSPGHEELKWLRPVRPGELLRGQVVVNSVRISKSRPEMGFVNNTATLTNPSGEVVYSLTSNAIIKTRAG